MSNLKKLLCNPPAERVAAMGDPKLEAMFEAVQDGLEHLSLLGQEELRDELAAKVVEIEEHYMQGRETLAIGCQNLMHATFIWVSEESYKRMKKKTSKESDIRKALDHVAPSQGQ